MKRSLISIVCVTATLLLILLLGSIFQIGDKLAAATGPAVEYAFYGVLGVLAIVFIVVPILRIALAPEMPALAADGQKDLKALQSLGRSLAQNCDYIADKEARSQHRSALSAEVKASRNDAEALSAVLQREIDYRLTGDADPESALGVAGVNRKIRQWAGSVFLVTAISQNSKFDSLAVMALNYKMIEDIVLSTGFRPTKPQMWKLCSRVLATAVLSYAASDIIGDLSESLGGGVATDAIDTTGNRLFGASRRLKLPGILLGSVVDGAVNALMTLRIGYVTRSYILGGAASIAGGQKRREVRRGAILESYKSIPSVIANAASVIGKSTAERLIKLFSKGDDKELQTI